MQRAKHLDRLDEVVSSVRRRPPETNRWFDLSLEITGAAMWNLIINLIYERSCERYRLEALGVAHGLAGDSPD